MCHSLERFTDTERGQKALNTYNERVKLARSKKRALETAVPEQESSFKATVISSAKSASLIE